MRKKAESWRFCANVVALWWDSLDSRLCKLSGGGFSVRDNGAAKGSGVVMRINILEKYLHGSRLLAVEQQHSLLGGEIMLRHACRSDNQRCCGANRIFHELRGTLDSLGPKASRKQAKGPREVRRAMRACFSCQ